MSSLFLFSSAKPESCNVAINEEHVPLAGKETGLEQLCPSPGQWWVLGSAIICSWQLGFCFGGLQHLREPLLKRPCVLGTSPECGYAQEPRAHRETQNDSWGGVWWSIAHPPSWHSRTVGLVWLVDPVREEGGGMALRSLRWLAELGSEWHSIHLPVYPGIPSFGGIEMMKTMKMTENYEK